jgi:hypothetical protein
MMMGPTLSPWARKLVFPWKLRIQIWRYLYGLNIHPFTLFPDLEGLARLVRQKNHVYWSKD